MGYKLTDLGRNYVKNVTRIDSRRKIIRDESRD
jgi:hypothetical protein